MAAIDSNPETASTAVPQAPGKHGDDASKSSPAHPEAHAPQARPREIGGPKGPEPTRYGDWERNGRVSDF